MKPEVFFQVRISSTNAGPPRWSRWILTCRPLITITSFPHLRNWTQIEDPKSIEEKYAKCTPFPCPAAARGRFLGRIELLLIQVFITPVTRNFWGPKVARTFHAENGNDEILCGRPTVNENHSLSRVCLKIHILCNAILLRWDVLDTKLAEIADHLHDCCPALEK